MAAAEFVEICLSAKHSRCGASSSQRPKDEVRGEESVQTHLKGSQYISKPLLYFGIFKTTLS